MTDGKPAARITGQIALTAQQPDGSYARGVEVSFETAKGHTGSVFVPYSDYTLEHVHQAVRDRAMLIDSIIGSEVR